MHLLSICGLASPLRRLVESQPLPWTQRVLPRRRFRDRFRIGHGIDGEKSPPGISPLIHAILSGRKSCVQILVQAGVKINITDRKIGLSPITLASAYSDLEIFTVLLDSGENIDLAVDRWSSLSYAVMNGNELILKKLLHAIEKDNQKTRKVFSTIINESRRLLIAGATVFGHEKMIELLLLSGTNIASVEYVSTSYLLDAIRYKHFPVMEVLLQHGANPNFVPISMPLLFYAVIEHKFEAARLLLQFGADPNKTIRMRNMSLQIEADCSEKAFDGETNGLISRFEYQINSSGVCPSLLSVAVATGNTQLCKLLLEHGADMHARDGHMDNPIFYASNLETLRLLL